MDCVCIYGYALFVYIPITVRALTSALPLLIVQILAVIPFDWVRWMLVGIAATISSVFLAGNLFMVRHPPVPDSHAYPDKELKASAKYGLILTAVVVALNVGLALTFKLYFFHLVDAPKSTPTTAPPGTTAPANATLHR